MADLIKVRSNAVEAATHLGGQGDRRQEIKRAGSFAGAPFAWRGLRLRSRIPTQTAASPPRQTPRDPAAGPGPSGGG